MELVKHTKANNKMDILEEIVANKRKELERQKEACPPSELYRQVERIMADNGRKTLSMSRSLTESKSGIIAEFKRRSPFKGWIKEEGTAETVPPEYCRNGAAAISILTDERYFGGRMEFIGTARPLVSCPILRKDFIVDEYQLFQAKAIGADAVLLIAADLSIKECRSLARTARDLQLETLLEIHSEAELDYIGEDIDMVGVNNRHLGSFHTDVATSFRLAPLLPDEFPLVSESGLRDVETIKLLRQAGFRGFLIGETFMRTTSPGETLRQWVEMIEA